MIEQLSAWIATGLATLVIGGFFGWLAATSEEFAGPRRAKSEASRSLMDKAIIEADKRIDALNIAQLEGFFADFVAAHLDDIIRAAPVIGPMATAADYLGRATEAFRRRNPGLAAERDPDPQTMQEKLAGAIGRAAKDKLTEALRDAGVR